MQFTLTAILAVLATSSSVLAAPASLEARGGEEAKKLLEEKMAEHTDPANHMVFRTGKAFSRHFDCQPTVENSDKDLTYANYKCGGLLLANGAMGTYDNWAMNGVGFKSLKNEDGWLVGGQFDSAE